jgi:aspartate/methionine/tyrosine aminotransferase
LTEGASQGVHLVLNAMITDKRDSILVPVPQYPLYSGVIELVGGHLQEYYQN